MKKAILLISVLSLILTSLIACGSNTEQKSYREQMNDAIVNGQNEYQQEVEDRKNAFENNQVKAPEGVKIYSTDERSFGEATLKSFYVTGSSYNSNDNFIFLTYDYTNTSEDDCGFYGLNYYYKVYQDGVELVSILGEHNKDQNTAVRPGTTIEVVECFMLRDTQSDIEICVFGENHADIAQEYKFPIK